MGRCDGKVALRVAWLPAPYTRGGNRCMVADMSTLLDQAIAKIRRLSKDRQDEAAELLMAVVDQDPDTVRLTPEQQAEVRRRLRAPGAHASHKRVRTYFEKPAA